MPIIGVDLGTSNSAGAALRGRPIIIPSAEGVTLGGNALGKRDAVLASRKTDASKAVLQEASQTLNA